MDNTSLTAWRVEARSDMPLAAHIEPWKPEPLSRDQWPPNYRTVYAWRAKTLAALRRDPRKLASAKKYYARRPAEFIQHWCDTYDPRRSGSKWVPFVFFMRQADLILFIDQCSRDNADGLIEKCRDMGATWGACAYSVHSWLFRKDDAIGWGSRKEQLVDQVGNPDSIFEKMRLLVSRIPDVFLPKGLDPRKHMTFMKFINPENGSTISGEAGDNIGRGGRKRLFFKDEGAFYDRPEKIEAALGDNTKCQIDISSVNGTGNVFHRRRENGVDWHPGRPIKPGFVRVLVMDWRDHPEKTQEWYDTRKAKYEREGMAHVFASEVDRNYSAAIKNKIIEPEWIDVSIDAHKRIRWRDDKGVIHTGIPQALLEFPFMAGLDIADDGEDRNALCLRQNIVTRGLDEWDERDPGVATRRVIAMLRELRGVTVNYDSIGMGVTVKSEINRLMLDDGVLSKSEINFVAWNAGAGVIDGYARIVPDDPTSILVRNFFANLKAQAWWSVRTRFYKTWRNITTGEIYPIDDLISLDSSLAMLPQLRKELAQPTRGETSQLKTLVNKKPNNTRSPNLADALIMAYFPIETSTPILVGSYGT